MPTSLRRATGFAFQPVAGTPATTVGWWAHYIEKVDIKDVAAQDIVLYEKNQRAMQGDVAPTTMYSAVTITLRVDTREFPRYLLAGGSYSFATSTHHIIFGDDIASYLTMWRYDGITGEMRQVHDMVLNTMSVQADYTAGTVTATLEFLGAQWVALTSGLPTITISAYSTHKRPYTARQSVLLRAGAAFCPLVSDLKVNNDVGPLYCGPSVDPTTGDPTYLSPDELQPGPATGTLDITARYTGYSNTILEDSRLSTERLYVLRQTDPSATPAVFLWTFPRFNPTPGHLDSDPTKRQQRQQASGPLLEDDATGGFAKLDITGNGDAAYI